MNQSPFESLRFDRRGHVHISPRGMWLGGVIAGYLLAWLVFPPAFLFWLGLPVIGILAWVASFSWKGALGAIDQVIHRIDKL